MICRTLILVVSCMFLGCVTVTVPGAKTGDITKTQCEKVAKAHIAKAVHKAEETCKVEKQALLESMPKPSDE